MLSIAAVVSLALGFFQDFGPARDPNQPPVDWVEGVAIIVAVCVVVLVGSINDWQKERQFQVLNAKKEERMLKVIRAGIERQINVHDVVVGDIALLEPGEIIPCDGVFLSGNNVRCDESGATGESDTIKKLSYEECIALRDAKLRECSQGSSPAASVLAIPGGEEAAGGDGGHRDTRRPSGMDLLGHTDCFVVSGSKVLEGVGKYVVISVGTRSFNGRIMMGTWSRPFSALSLLIIIVTDRIHIPLDFNVVQRSVAMPRTRPYSSNSTFSRTQSLGPA